MKPPLAFLLFVFLMVFGAAVSSAQETGYLVLAPDRGFLGNEEIRETFAEFRKEVPSASLAFATAEETGDNLGEALGKLNADQIVVLPLFPSAGHDLYIRAKEALPGVAERPISFAEPFGEHYLAEEIFFDRVERLVDEQGAGSDTYLILVGAGAASPQNESDIKASLLPMAQRAAQKYGLAGGDVVVNYTFSAPGEASRAASRRNQARIQEAAEKHGRVLVVPFSLDMKFTNMMSQWHWMQRGLASIDDVVANGENILPHRNAVRWLQWASAGHGGLDRSDVGVVMIPHGATYNWNERMRECIAPVREEYTVEEAFSMVDAGVVERAVRRLEERDKEAAVVVRIFSLTSSFREKAEYVLGLTPEMQHPGHGGAFPARINSHLRFATLGGVEDSRHFARALLDRARSISTDPSRETVILLGHGTGSDAANDRWMDNLASIADQMRADGGSEFRDIQYQTWREDWPDKREESVAAIREMVREASAGNGIALVIPARTTAQGPADKYLDGLDYKLGVGFCPHPEFAEWLREEIEKGMAQLGVEGAPNL